MSRKNSFKNNNKKISKVKRNTYSNNNVSLVKQEPEKQEEKEVVAFKKTSKKKRLKNVVTSVALKKEPQKEEKRVSVSPKNEDQTVANNSQSKYIMIISFACLGFIFTFLANFGFFDMTKALLAGFWGFAGGAAFAYFPYWLASREK